MKRRIILALVAVLCVAALAPSQTTAASTSYGLQLLSSKKLSGRLRELTFRTKALAEDTKVRVLLPSGYDTSGKTRYPVLFLLHGGLGSHLDWTDQGAAEKITAPYKTIVVMPDGGGDGNYVDWYNYGEWGPPAWETYHLRQLLPWIDAHYATTKSRNGRAIAGLSMGGAGATHYAARHPGLFTAVASFSGALDTNNPIVIPVTETSGLQSGKPPGSAYGPRLLHEIRWRGDNATDLAENFRGMSISVATGNGEPSGEGDCTNYDGVEAQVHEQSVVFHEALVDLGIQHLWDDYGPGCHNWFYWQRELRDWLPRMAYRFAHPKAPPSPFNFRATEPSYPIYGWTVKVDRPEMEWSELRNVTPKGFTLKGSGRATVTTPRYFRAGERVTVTTFNRSGVSRKVVVARSDGRLPITLTLGPANPYQQHTPLEKAWLLTQAMEDGLGNAPGQLLKTRVYTATVNLQR